MRNFGTAREWEKFHSPKNLAMALAAEAGELLECFQWLTEDQSRNLSEDKKLVVGEEMADVFIYLLQLADKLDINLQYEACKKIDKNEARYPAEKVSGSSKKYTEY